MFFRSVRKITEYFCELAEAKNGIRILTLQNPSRKNALSSVLVKQLQGHLADLQVDVNAKTLILNSNVENVFCAGADLKERMLMPENQVEAFVKSLRVTFNMIEDLPFPTIACIEGFALGGGLEMALACDLRIGSPNAKVGLVETGIAGIPGAGGTYRLPRLIGLQRAKEMIYTAGIYQADKAKDFGVFNEISKNALERCMEIAENIGKNGPVAVKMAKKAIDLAWGKDRNTGMDIEGLCYAGIVGTEDRVEALTAFKEKRKPIFKGK